MPDLSQCLIFIGVAAAVTVAPGPDIIFVITQGITAGRRAGVMTALGLACGNFVHTTAAALGISLIFKTSAAAFWIFKILGALYLFYLAFKILKNKAGIISIEKGTEEEERQEESSLRLMSRGFIMNVMNPKVALFFLAFLPQFTNPEIGNVPAQIIIFGLMFILLVVIIFGLVGFFAGYAGAWLTRYQGFNRGMGYVTVFIYAGLAVKLLASSQ